MASGPFIICGMGHVGRQVALLLRRLGHQVVVITQKPREDWLRGARELGIEILLGDARDSQLLTTANIGTAQALLATTSLDAVNIEIALDARRLRPDLPVVVRLFDQTLARSIEGAKSFGVRRAFGVSALAAPTLASALLGTEVQASFTIGDHSAPATPADAFVIGHLTGDPPPGSGVDLGALAGGGRLFLTSRATWQRLTAPAHPQKPPSQPGHGRLHRLRSQLRLPLEIWRNAPLPLRSVFSLLLLLIAASVIIFRYGMRLSLTDAFYFIVTTVTTTGYGDITPKDHGNALKLYSCLLMVLGSSTTALLYSVLTDFVVNERFRAAFGQQRLPERGHVIIVGLGNVGYRVLEELRRQGLPLVAINRTTEGEFFEAVRSSCKTLVGDGRLPETLLRAGLPGARGLVAATDDDATNLAIALAALELRPDLPVVVRLLDAEFASKVRMGLKLHAAFSTAALAAPAFVAAALGEGARAGLLVEDWLLSVYEQQAAASWQGLTAAAIAAQFGVRPILRLADATSFLDDSSLIGSGERLLVLHRQALTASS